MYLALTIRNTAVSKIRFASEQFCLMSNTNILYICMYSCLGK